MVQQDAAEADITGNAMQRAPEVLGCRTRIMALPDVQARMAKLDIKPVGGSSTDFAKVISQEIQLWAQVAKENNIKAAATCLFVGKFNMTCEVS